MKILTKLFNPTKHTEMRIRLEVQLEYEQTFRILQGEMRANKAKLANISALVSQCTTDGIITHEEALNKIMEVLG